MGFFDKLKKGLAKTRESLTGKIEKLVLGYADIDDDLLDELEETLIMADVGVKTTEKLMQAVRKGIKQKKINALRKLIELKQSKIPAQVNWTPVVIFDHIPPFRINKKGITIYQTGSSVQEKTVPGTLPFIFNSHDLKPQN